MANSRVEYVRNFEPADNLLPATYLVVRIDGKGFHRSVFPLVLLICVSRADGLAGSQMRTLLQSRMTKPRWI